MNDLNTQQVILLTLLVSFVVSIATGITTVSLLEQAPEGVTQTINRVVERTVETIVPVEGEPKVVREVETVVVNQEDLTIDAVSKNSKSLVRIKDDNSFYLGLGVIVDGNGTIIADSGILANGNGAKYKGVMSDGTDLTLTVKETKSGVAIIKPIIESGEQITFNSAIMGSSDNLQLGQSVISIGGKETNLVDIGIISTLYEPSSDEETQKYLGIDTTIKLSSIEQGSPLINLRGDLIGIKVGSLGTSRYLPINVVKSSFSEIFNPGSTTKTE